MGYAFFWIFFDDLLGFRRVRCGWFVEMATCQERGREENYSRESADDPTGQAVGEMPRDVVSQMTTEMAGDDGTAGA